MPKKDDASYEANFHLQPSRENNPDIKRSLSELPLEITSKSFLINSGKFHNEGMPLRGQTVRCTEFSGNFLRIIARIKHTNRLIPFLIRGGK